MKSAFIAGISAFALATAAYAGNQDIVGGADGAVTIHSCAAAMTEKNYASPYNPTAARMVQNKLNALGYYDKPGKGRKQKGAMTAASQFQRDMGIKETGVGPTTAMALAQATASNRRIARCLQITMN